VQAQIATQATSHRHWVWQGLGLDLDLGLDLAVFWGKQPFGNSKENSGGFLRGEFWRILGVVDLGLILVSILGSILAILPRRRQTSA